MTEIEKKALALVNEVRREHGYSAFLIRHVEDDKLFLALCRVVEELEAEKAARAVERKQHEAFRQEVSDAVEEYADRDTHAPITYLGRFIIAKPDPLVEAMLGAWPQYADRMDACAGDAKALRAAIEARGGKIVWGEG